MAQYPPIIVLVLASVLLIQCQQPAPEGQGQGQEPGSCPPLLPVDQCEATCGADSPCVNATQLCCPTACGGSMCVDAMTQRQFVYLVKKGTCPEFPRGPWVCTNMCTGDSDCPRALKCCPNRCGALACQKPETEDETPAENTVTGH